MSGAVSPCSGFSGWRLGGGAESTQPSARGAKAAWQPSYSRAIIDVLELPGLAHLMDLPDVREPTSANHRGASPLDLDLITRLLAQLTCLVRFDCYRISSNYSLTAWIFRRRRYR